MRPFADLVAYVAGGSAAVVAATTRNPGWTLVAFIVGLAAGIAIGRWSNCGRT